jgi:glycosyltransferase involved in cell wall biosynthesis
MLSAEETQLYKKLNLTGKFVVQYSGNMGLWHDIETIVRAAGLLKAHPQIHFVMVGDGIRKKKAFELAGELQLTNMTWLTFQPKETLSDSLSCCHAALISQCEGLQGVAVPSKLYGILASGRPVLGMVPMGSETDRVIAEEHCGISLNAAQPEDLANAIIKLANNPQEAVNMGKNSFFAYKSKYQIDSAVSQFKALWKNEVALKSR